MFKATDYANRLTIAISLAASLYTFLMTLANILSASSSKNSLSIK